MSTESTTKCDVCKAKVSSNYLVLHEPGFYASKAGRLLPADANDGTISPSLDFCNLACLDEWCKEHV